MRGASPSYEAMLKELEKEGSGFTMEPSPLPDEKAIEWFGEGGDEIVRRLELSCMQVTWPNGKVAYCIREEDYTRAKAAALAMQLMDESRRLPRTPEQRRERIHDALRKTVEKFPNVPLPKILGADSVEDAEETLCHLVENVIGMLPEAPTVMQWPDDTPTPEEIEAMPEVRIAMTAFLMRPASETVMEAISTIAIALTKKGEKRESVH